MRTPKLAAICLLFTLTLYLGLADVYHQTDVTMVDAAGVAVVWITSFWA